MKNTFSVSCCCKGCRKCMRKMRRSFREVYKILKTESKRKGPCERE